MMQHPEIAPGLYGTGITVVSGVIAFCTAAVPVMQFFALLATIVAGFLTSIWTYKKIRAHNLEASAKVAAAALKAAAIVTATALEDSK